MLPDSDTITENWYLCADKKINNIMYYWKIILPRNVGNVITLRTINRVKSFHTQSNFMNVQQILSFIFKLANEKSNSNIFCLKYRIGNFFQKPEIFLFPI